MFQFICKDNLIIVKVSSSLTVLSGILALTEIGDRTTEFNTGMASSSECAVFIYINYSKTNNDSLCFKGGIAQFIMFKYLSSFR